MPSGVSRKKYLNASSGFVDPSQVNLFGRRSTLGLKCAWCCSRILELMPSATTTRSASAKRSNAKLLLDVNNVFVNSENHGFDPREYLSAIPKERVVQIHVAGHMVRDDQLIIDTHGEAVRDEVYELLEHTLRHTGPVPVLLERDQNFPEFEQIIAEVKRLATIYDRATRPSVPDSPNATATVEAT